MAHIGKRYSNEPPGMDLLLLILVIVVIGMVVQCSVHWLGKLFGLFVN